MLPSLYREICVGRNIATLAENAQLSVKVRAAVCAVWPCSADHLHHSQGPLAFLISGTISCDRVGQWPV